MVKPSLLLVRALQNAVSTALPRGTDEQIDVSNFVAVTDERFTYTNSTNLGHKPNPP